MAMDFPASPTPGQVYAPVGSGATYVWSGSAWDLQPTAVAVNAVIGDTPPVAPIPGQLWWNSTTSNMYLWFNDGNSSQWVQVSSTYPVIPGDIDLDGAKIIDLGSLNGGPLGGFRNKIINGNFDFWQRGSPQTINGYGSDDRWANGNNGSTKTHSVQTFALGQTDVPGNPKYFSRTVAVSVAGAGNAVYKHQSIENVALLAGKTVTITFYAKADAPKNIALEVYQNFGTGGSPSAIVNIPLGLQALSASWQKFTVVTTLPSIVGKTLGSGNNDSTALRFWFDAGSSFATIASSLGQQSGTFDIAHVSVVEGDATKEDDPFAARHIQQELALCQRYYEVGAAGNSQYLVSGIISAVNVQFKITKRGTPALGYSPTSNGGVGVFDARTPSVSGLDWFMQSNVTGQCYFNGSWSADAEL